MSAGDSHPARFHRLPWLLLPLSLWLFATLFLHGDLGKWNDDYFFLGQFDVETGRVKVFTLDRPLHFWRPVYRSVATPLITALFHHDQILHIVSATVHGLTCLLLYGLMRRLHLSRPASGLAAMLMLVWPSHYEVVFWNTCNFTAVATAGCLAGAWLYMNWLERSPGRWGGWPVALVMGALGFLVAGTNEQPAAAIAALPILGLALVLAPPGAAAAASIARSGGRWRALLRAAVPAAASAAGVAAYVVVQVRWHPPAPGSTIGSVVAPGELPRRLAGLAGEVWSHLWFNNLRADAAAMGRAALADQPVSTVIAVAALALGAALWVRAAAPARAVPERPAPPRWRVALIVFGLAWFVICWAPIARIIYPTSARLFYAPLAGLAISCAAVLDLLIGSPRHAPLWRAAVSSGIIVVAVGAAVIMVGIQRAYQSRWRADEEQARRLVLLVPDPPARAIFVPIRATDAPGGTMRSPFTDRFYPPLHSPWAGGWWLQRAYRRKDVFAAQAIGPWDRVPLEAVPADDSADGSARLARPLNPIMPPFRADRRTGSAFPWKRVVPFEIDDAGRVRVFREVRIRRSGEPDQLLVLDHIPAGAVEPGQAALNVALRRAAEGAESED